MWWGFSVKITYCKFKKTRWLFIAAALLCTLYGANGVLSEELPLYKIHEEQEGKIRITARNLVTDNEANYAEFTGDVIATQGTSIITSDKLKIYYRNADDSPNQEGADTQGKIEKIVADGNVFIRSESKVGQSEHAEYLKDSGLLILTGKDSKVTSGNNSVMGSKITINRVTDKMIVEQDSNQRVEAVLYSEEKVLE